MPGLMEAIEKIIMKHYAFPQLVKVTHSSAGKDGYFIDGEGITPGSYETTGELFKEVPVSPLWASGDGRGIFMPPSEDQIVIVGFIGGNKAFPFVSGIYGEEYKPTEDAETETGKISICDANGFRAELDAEGNAVIEVKDKISIEITKDGNLTIEDSNETKIELNGGKLALSDKSGGQYVLDSGKLTVGNNSGSVKSLLEEIIDIISGLQTTGTGNMGAPVISSPMPTTTSQCSAAKSKVGQVFGG